MLQSPNHVSPQKDQCIGHEATDAEAYFRIHFFIIIIM